MKRLKTMMWKPILVMGLLIVIVGCTPTPAPTPTVDEQVLAGTLQVARTEAAETVVAQITDEALRNPSATPTSTATSTQTATPLPTATPVPPTPTYRPVITYTCTPAAFRCSIESQTPPSGQDLSPGSDFDAKWVVKNTGTDSWDANGMDYYYTSGTHMEKHGDSFDLPQSVDPGETVEIVVDMLAPTDSGRYTTAWTIGQSGVVACIMSITIDVP